jgi:hypothetical protein
VSEYQKPVCEECGNDGTKGRLYVTIDARWDAERGGWVLERREDDGGDELDCLACDHRTPLHEVKVFPYDAFVEAQ